MADRHPRLNELAGRIGLNDRERSELGSLHREMAAAGQLLPDRRYVIEIDTYPELGGEYEEQTLYWLQERAGEVFLDPLRTGDAWAIAAALCRHGVGRDLEGYYFAHGFWNRLVGAGGLYHRREFSAREIAHAAEGADDDASEADLVAELLRAERRYETDRVLLRGAPGRDIWGEYETRSEAFIATGSEGELRAATALPAKHWERARATGSSAARGDGDFDHDGLTVKDAGTPQQRWLPRSHLADYMRALHVDDPARRLELTQALDQAIPPTSTAVAKAAKDAPEPPATQRGEQQVAPVEQRPTHAGQGELDELARIAERRRAERAESLAGSVSPTSTTTTTPSRTATGGMRT
jgi:hypothetical protein